MPKTSSEHFIKYDSTLKEEIRKVNDWGKAIELVSKVKLEDLDKAFKKIKKESITSSIKEAVRDASEELEKLHRELAVKAAVPFDEEERLENIKQIEELEAKIENYHKLFTKDKSGREIRVINKEHIQEAYDMALEYQDKLQQRIKDDEDNIEEMREVLGTKFDKKIRKKEI